MDSSQRAPSDPCLCAGGCGFYGSGDTHGFCSVCYKAQQSTALAAATAPSPSPAPAAAAAAADPAPAPAAEPMLVEPAPVQEEAASPAAASPAAAAAAAVASEAGDEKPVQENRGRCFCCRKKIGLLGFECRCGYVFCSGHRHAQDHACAFDFAAMDKAHLAKANTKVVAAKVDKL